MRLADLADAALGLDVRAFAERNPEPALVFFPTSSKPEPTPFDTLAGKEHRFDGAATDELPALETTIDEQRAKRPTDRIALPRYVRGKGPEGPEWSVHFLAKSRRNPFAGMITVGRASNNDIQLLVSSVSKFHASFTSLAGSWTVTDQNATNGTFVDGKRLESRAQAFVADGSQIGFGPDARAEFMTTAALFALLCRLRAGSGVQG